jgi:hypothetical protein
MSKKRMIELGMGPDGPVSIDLDILMRTRGYVSASSGGGKSHLLRRLIEQISPHVQCIVLDWEGEFLTLRKKFPFVLVGEGGETPAHPHTAAQVALTLLKLGASAVCDLYELRGNGRHEFVRNFVNAMVSAPKELWHPVVVFVDEAHYLCPENGYGESVAKDAIIDLCNLGRKRGFCPILATQRAAKVSKNATEPLQNMLIGLTMPDDQKRICEVFKIAPGAASREFSSQLETLDTGQFFARGSAVSKVKVLVKVGGTVTQPPPTGSAAAATRTPTPESIKKLLPQLADIPVEVERKAKTEAELRKEIEVLKKAKAPVTVAPSITPERERMLLSQISELQKTAGAYDRAMSTIYSSAAQIVGAAETMKKTIDEMRNRPASVSPQVKKEDERGGDPPEQVVKRFVEKLPHMRPVIDGAVSVNEPQQRILDSMATLYALEDAKVSLDWIAATAGTTPRARGFEENLRKLKVAGLVEGIRLTASGYAIARTVEAPATFSQTMTILEVSLSTVQIKMLRALKQHGAMVPDDFATLFETTVRARGFEENTRILKSRNFISLSSGKYCLAIWLEVLD